MKSIGPALMPRSNWKDVSFLLRTLRLSPRTRRRLSVPRSRTLVTARPSRQGRGRDDKIEMVQRKQAALAPPLRLGHNSLRAV
jgi:hypothetical protein